MKTKEKIFLIGGGGHSKACIDVIEEEGKFQIAGIIDRPERLGESIFGYKIIGIDDDIENLLSIIKHVLITVGHIKSSDLRKKLFNQIKKSGAKFPVIISPKAYVSKHAAVGEGTIIMHGAVVNAGALIGKNSIINNLSLIEHDVEIGDHVHISTGARINGNCTVGNNCFVGSGSILNQGVKIVDNVIIGSGSLVRKSINAPGLYAGNPLKKYK
jgi:sugar O-acyltransferase (sialic acid O-acetyltransferase NeuD family)